jgi:hypothetical protein
MLSGHPHIKRLQVKETFHRGRLQRCLVVDTDLMMPASGRIEENKPLLDLHNYLEMIAQNDFADFDEVEIHTHKVAMAEVRAA